ncbi:glycosyltransferase family 4 protein [Methylobacterium sp. J-078]|uniref:glycosyltransferase family 4 protein n=1 Tax=Methylobacterium sp. J-078 TaxID=2836657 RepID=UPI001FB8850F|nr:glycosyltransferase family 4 protein [Methylobacterium sp. J-078]MCJ2044180.1 glycosyltransferase family 4 protein [Methylobacterium sp. J-078]
MKVALLTNIVTPYTHRLFERMGQGLGGDLSVFACSETEPDRHWIIEPARHYRRAALAGLRLHRSYVSHIYLNPGIVPALLGTRYDVVVLSDFSPTMMMACAAARARRIPVIISTDGQPETDPGRHSRIHRLARRAIVPLCAAGVGASRGSLALLQAYGLAPEASFLSPIAPGWDFVGSPPDFDARPFDLLFCGHLDDDRKGALFFADVVDALVARGRRLTVRVAGDGPLRDALAERLRAVGVEARFDGFLSQEALAEAYASAKVFLFPSRGDPWGLVANEAIQCGTPVIASVHAQSALELVGPSGTGQVLPLAVAAWADAAERYLDDRAAWQGAHASAVAATRTFSIDAMTAGFLASFDYVTDRSGGTPSGALGASLGRAE